MKEKFKNYSFWISVSGAVLLLINNLGKVFGFSVDNEAVFSIVDGVCGVLVVFGILTMNKTKKTTNTNTDQNVTDLDNTNTIQEQLNIENENTEQHQENTKIEQTIDQHH